MPKAGHLRGLFTGQDSGFRDISHQLICTVEPEILNLKEKPKLIAFKKVGSLRNRGINHNV